MYIHHIWRWHHSNGRKQGETKEPLDESERGEWKSLLKTQHSKNEYHGIQSHHLMANRWRKNENIKSVTDFIFFGSKITADSDYSHKVKRHLLLGRKAMTNLDSLLKSRDITLPTRVRLVQAMFFLVVTYGCLDLDHKEGWVLKNWCFWTVVLKKTLENPLDCKIKPVIPKGSQPWIFIGRTDTEAEAPILWPPDAKSRLIGKDPDAGKD